MTRRRAAGRAAAAGRDGPERYRLEGKDEARRERRANTLLALDAGVRETGWAVFLPGGAIDTGVIRLSRSRTLHAAERVSHLVESLDRLAERWQPGAVAYGQPAGIRWPAPSLELLDDSLARWATGRQLPLFTYSGQEVRAAIARHSRVPQDQLAYAIMLRLRLIGARKSTPEWEALAIGYYHLCRTAARRQEEKRKNLQ